MKKGNRHNNDIVLKKGIALSLHALDDVVREKGMSINKIYEKTVKALVKKDKKIIKPTEVFDNYKKVKGKIKIEKKKKSTMVNWRDKSISRDRRKRSSPLAL